MSEADQSPATPPPPAPQEQPKPEATPRPERPRLGPRPPRGRREGQERREPLSEKPPSLEDDQRYAGRVSVKEFDAQIEQELEEAMSGMSARDIYGEPNKQPARPAAEPQPGALSGKVISVHNA